MSLDLAAQDSLRRKRDWKTALFVGATASVLMSTAYWLGEMHYGAVKSAAITPLINCLFAAGIAGIIAGEVTGIIASRLALGDLGIIIAALFTATCVNFGLYTVVTYTGVRGFRAVTRGSSARNR